MSRVPTHLWRNSYGVFYFRCTIPEKLRPVVGKKEIRKSLGTGLRSEAILLAQRYYLAIYDKLLRANGMGKDDSFKLIFMELFEAPGIKAKNVTIDTGNAETDIEALGKLMGLRGNTVKTEDAGAVLLADVMAKFCAEKVKDGSWRPKTEEENKGIFDLLIRILGNVPMSQLGHEAGRKFKDKLLLLPPGINKGEYAGRSIDEVIALKAARTMSIVSVNKYLSIGLPVCLSGLRGMVMRL